MMRRSNDMPLTYEQAKDKALRLLEFRRHSEKELRAKLRRAGAEDDDIERIIEFCTEYKFIDDEEFARLKAADLKNLKKYGKRRIERELVAAGINPETVSIVMDELDFDDEEDRLYPLVEKKLGGEFEKKNIDRCIRYFMYRGYDFYKIKHCIEKAQYEHE